MNTLSKWEPYKGVRWDPFREMEDLSNRVSSIFGLAPLRGDGGREEALTVAQWSPVVDIIEDAKEYLIKAELPEMKREEVKVTVENGVLTLCGERKFEHEEKGKKFHRIERSYGSYTRSFSLPDDADGEKVSAVFKDGLLQVHLPKNEKARPKSIEVKVT